MTLGSAIAYDFDTISVAQYHASVDLPRSSLYTTEVSRISESSGTYEHIQDMLSYTPFEIGSLIFYGRSTYFLTEKRRSELMWQRWCKSTQSSAGMKSALILMFILPSRDEIPRAPDVVIGEEVKTCSALQQRQRQSLKRVRLQANTTKQNRWIDASLKSLSKCPVER